MRQWFITLILAIAVLSSSPARAEGWGKSLGGFLSELPLLDGWRWLMSINDTATITPADVQQAQLRYVVMPDSSSRVNVRSHASAQSRIIGKVAAGDSVVVVSKDPFQQWFKVAMADGSFGYIHQSLLVDERLIPKPAP